MAVDDPTGGLLKDIFGFIAAGVAGLLAWAWRSTMGRLDRLERCTVRKADFDKLEDRSMDKEDFREFVERSEQYRREARDGINDLHKKLDTLQQTILRCVQLHRIPPED